MDPAAESTSGRRPPESKDHGRSAALSALLDLIVERGYERRDEPFALSSGGFSHDYVDLRRAVARGVDLELAARAVIEQLEAAHVDYELIGGMTMGADPVAHAVALVARRAWFSVRKAQKGHGRRQRIEGGTVDRGARVVLFEDTVSTGGSIFEAYEVLAEAGAEIVAACTLLDRGDHAARRFAALEVPYLALLSYRDLGIEPIEPAGAAGGAAPD